MLPAPIVTSGKTIACAPIRTSLPIEILLFEISGGWSRITMARDRMVRRDARHKLAD
jgi:type III secretory pathway component EscR